MYILWNDHANGPVVQSSRQTPTSIDLKLRNASAKNYSQLVKSLLRYVQNAVVHEGFDFGSSGIILDWSVIKRKRAGPVASAFPSVELVRSFHYQYKDFEWDSEDGSQTIIIELQHVVFDKEMCDPRVRLAVSSVKALTPSMVKSIAGGISN